MAKTFTYNFGNIPNTELTIVTTDTAQPVQTGDGRSQTADGATSEAFAILSISGTFNGQKILGLYGNSATYQNDRNGDYQVNAIFTANSQGEKGSKSGIDQDGIAFQLNNGRIVNLHEAENGTFTYDISRFRRSISRNNTITLTSSNYDQVTCFCPGTLIRTARGEVAVEDLRAGDHVVTVSGGSRPVVWVGHRTLGGEGELPFAQCPVRVLAGAFGPGLPARDLLLSPGHPVLVGADEDGMGGHLVPVMCLVNGTTVERERRASVTYWHVELDAHDILLAEGLPAESYLDWGDRGFFTEGADHALMNPDLVVPGLDARCRPVAVEGPVVDAERRRLDAVFAQGLAAACAWPGDTDSLAAYG